MKMLCANIPFYMVKKISEGRGWGGGGTGQWGWLHSHKRTSEHMETMCRMGS